MSVLINTVTMQIVKAAPTVEQCEVWAETLIPRANDFVICGFEKRHYTCFLEEELRLLIHNTIAKQAPQSCTYAELLKRAVEACTYIEEDVTPTSAIPKGLPVVTQSSIIAPPPTAQPVTTTDRPPWVKPGTTPTTTTEGATTIMATSKTKPGSKKTASKKTAAKKTVSKKTATKRTASKKAATKKTAAKAAPAAATATPAAAKAAPKLERVRQNDVLLPLPGSKAGMAWEIADKLSAKAGEPAKRADVIEAGVKAGLSASGVSSDFQTWRKFHGLTGS